MIHPQYEKLAKVLIRYSTNLQKGEKILIEAIDAPLEMIQAIVREVHRVKGIPVIEHKSLSLMRELYMGATEESMKFNASCEMARMKKMDAWIGIRGFRNSKELADVPAKKLELYEKLWLHPVHLRQRVGKTKWVILRVPTPNFAQAAKMSTEAFEEFYFNACTGVNWKKASKSMDTLADLMNKTDKVHIKGPGTDLNFSIKDISAVKCDGGRNIPDLEVFSAPVKNSVNGVLQFNTSSTLRGFTFENIRFEFKDGKIVDAKCNDSKRLNKVLDTDAGARYIGEFSLGLHPLINEPIDDTLFDEKINGSFHFTPGNAYENEADNGNRSAIHWDLVCIQTKAFGGGEIYFDDQLIRQDGRFVPKFLHKLNPENLII